MSFFGDFKREIKLFLIVAVVSAVLAVGGILLLQAGLGPSSPTPASPTPTPTLSPQPQATDTEDFTLSEVEGWQTYCNDGYGFEFEYPIVFAEDSQCRVASSENGIRVGSRVSIAVRDAGGLELAEYMEQNFDTEYLFEVEKNNTTVGGKEGIAISYHVQGTGRLGTETYVLNDGKVYIFSYLAGGECPAAYAHDISELNVLFQILATFRFVEEREEVATVPPAFGVAVDIEVSSFRRTEEGWQADVIISLTSLVGSLELDGTSLDVETEEGVTFDGSEYPKSLTGILASTSPLKLRERITVVEMGEWNLKSVFRIGDSASTDATICIKADEDSAKAEERVCDSPQKIDPTIPSTETERP